MNFYQIILCFLIMNSAILSSPVRIKASQSFKPGSVALVKSGNSMEFRPEHRQHPYGGVMVWGDINQPTIINPILTQSSVSAALLELIFDALVKIDDNGHVVPGIARSWVVSEDQKEYTFFLERGVYFHDGRELTAEDVKFTYDAIQNPENDSPWRLGLDLIETWTVLDKYRIQMRLKQPFQPIMFKLVREIAPKHLLAGQDLNNNPFNYAPIGSGPFRFKAWNPQTHQIDLTFNPSYFKGRPYLDTFIVKIYPDTEKLWAAFMRGEIDMVQWLNRKNFLIVKEDVNFRAYKLVGSFYYAILYNSQDSIWRDKLLRQAIVQAINREDIIKALPGFGGEVYIGPFHPNSEGYNHDVVPFEYDPIKAKALLSEIGWQKTPLARQQDDDHFLKKDGRILELRLLIDKRNKVYRRIVKVIRQQLAEIGVKVVIIFYTESRALTQSFLDQHQPNAWLRQFSGLGLDPHEAVESWHSLSSDFGKLWQYKNDRLDRLFKAGQLNRNDKDRVKIYRQIHKIIYDDQPASFLFFPAWYFAVNSKIKNTDAYFSRFMPTHMIKDWYIAPQ